MSRTDQIIKHLREALHDAHLYSDDELRYMKTQLRQLEEGRQQFLREDKNGFGS